MDQARMDEIAARHAAHRQRQERRAALRAMGISSMTVNCLFRQQMDTKDDRWLDPEWLATRTAGDLMGIRGLGRVGREKLMATVDMSTPCPCCGGTGCVPRDSTA
jgi:hypothetical protein